MEQFDLFRSPDVVRTSGINGVDVGAFNKACRGVALLTAPLRFLYDLVMGAIKTMAASLVLALIAACGVFWVCYRFVLRVFFGVPVEWSPSAAAPNMRAAYWCALLLMFTYPFMSMWVFGLSWVPYRESRGRGWKNRHYAGYWIENFLVGVLGFVYGLFVLLVEYLAGGGEMGTQVIILTVMTCIPLGLSLLKRGKGGYVAVMAIFVGMEFVAFLPS